jgi:hypothetical protein
VPCPGDRAAEGAVPEGQAHGGRVYPTVSFDGSALPSGLYLVRMSTAGDFSQTQRLTVLR